MSKTYHSPFAESYYLSFFKKTSTRVCREHDGGESSRISWLGLEARRAPSLTKTGTDAWRRDCPLIQLAHQN